MISACALKASCPNACLEKSKATVLPASKVALAILAHHLDACLDVTPLFSTTPDLSQTVEAHYHFIISIIPTIIEEGLPPETSTPLAEPTDISNVKSLQLQSDLNRVKCEHCHNISPAFVSPATSTSGYHNCTIASHQPT